MILQNQSNIPRESSPPQRIKDEELSEKKHNTSQWTCPRTKKTIESKKQQPSERTGKPP